MWLMWQAVGDNYHHEQTSKTYSYQAISQINLGEGEVHSLEASSAVAALEEPREPPKEENEEGVPLEEPLAKSPGSLGSPEVDVVGRSVFF